MNGCWNCSSPLHHRRDCDVPVSKEDARRCKFELRKEFRVGRVKTPAEKLEWNRKLAAREQKPLPRRFIREHMESSLQEILDAEHELFFIGVPSDARLDEQLQRVTELKLRFLSKMSRMREIVTAGKSYVKSLKSLDQEDLHFKWTLEDLDEKRQPMLCMIVKAMADLQEVKRQEPFLENLAKVITMEIAECKIGLRERSTAEAELLLLKMRDITPLLAEYRQKLSRIQSICPKFKDPVASALQQQFDELWAHKMKLDQEQVQQLRNKVVFNLDFN